jgi:tRNA (cytidine/uridine-2'-O-)-methyltransferase
MGRYNNTAVGPEDRLPKDRKLTREGALTIVLLHPRIPQNTGSIARLCAATGSRLDLIKPLFEIDDKKLRRAGLDYWHLLDVRFFESLDQWMNQFEKTPNARLWLVEVGGKHIYSDVRFEKGDYIMFGDEQEGIPVELLERFPQFSLRLPQQGVRSINLANAVSIVNYEALRQLGWLGLS